MLNKLKKYFLSGLIVFLPVALTINLIFLAVNFAEGIFGKFLKPIFAENFGFYFSGLGIIIGVYIIILIGFFVTNFLGKKIYEFFENLLIKVPIVKQIYPALKEMVMFLFTREKFSSFKKVVLVEYREDVWDRHALGAGQAVPAVGAPDRPLLPVLLLDPLE